MTTFEICTAFAPDTVMAATVAPPPPGPPLPPKRATRTPSSVVGKVTVGGKVRPAAVRGAIVTLTLGRPSDPNGQRDQVVDSELASTETPFAIVIGLPSEPW